MKTEQITLTGDTQYNEKFPPRDAKKGYVAKIKGRVTGPMKYDREFFGMSATVLEGDEGLYERQIGEKKGGSTRYYHVILSHPEHGLIMSADCESEVAKIAKMLGEGVSIADAVEVTEIRPSQKFEGRMVFSAVARSASAAKSSAKSASVESAVDQCWELLKLLPEKEAKKVLASLKNLVSPKIVTTKEEVESENSAG